MSLAPHPALTTPPICGNTALDAESERRLQVLRAEAGGKPDGGCGRQMNWLSAYRCLECGRWMHADCLRQHFVEHGDRAAIVEQERDALQARLAAAERAAPKWIDGPPTEPGAYWWCFHDGKGKPINGTMRVSVVHQIGPRLMVGAGEGGLSPVSKPQRLWYGPLREPEVPD